MQKTNHPKKSVRITLYVVKPKKRSVKPGRAEQLAGHHRHPPFITGASTYDRRAQLLLYSRQLRAANKKTQPQQKAKESLKLTSFQSLKISGQNCHAEAAEQISPAFSWKILSMEKNPSKSELPKPPPSCFGDWRRTCLSAFFCVKRIKKPKDEKRETKKKKSLKKNKKQKKMTLSFSGKMSAIMMSSRMEKERIGVMAKFLSALRAGC